MCHSFILWWSVQRNIFQESLPKKTLLECGCSHSANLLLSEALRETRGKVLGWTFGSNHTNPLFLLCPCFSICSNAVNMFSGKSVVIVPVLYQEDHQVWFTVYMYSLAGICCGSFDSAPCLFSPSWPAGSISLPAGLTASDIREEHTICLLLDHLAPSQRISG